MCLIWWTLIIVHLLHINRSHISNNNFEFCDGIKDAVIRHEDIYCVDKYNLYCENNIFVENDLSYDYFISLVLSGIFGRKATTSGLLLKRILLSTDTPFGTSKLFNYILIKYVYYKTENNLQFLQTQWLRWCTEENALVTTCRNACWLN